MRFDAVVVAGGSGARAGGPKQWRALAGRPVLWWSVEALAVAGARRIVVVHPTGEAERVRTLIARPVLLAEGGASRFASVKAGVAALDDDPPDAILVHDAARPGLTVSVVADLLANLDGAEAALPVLPTSDTLKRSDDGAWLTGPAPERSRLFRAQTPQAFHWTVFRRALEAWRADDDPTDDIAIVEAVGARVRMTAGGARLMKLTYPEDFAMLEALLAPRASVRVGSGFDAHRFGEGDHVWLCGVRVPHDAGLIGHSDADVGLHALTDALLGAIAAGDIGDHFPPSDPRWKGAASDRFLRHALDLVKAARGRVVQIDVTLICERPRIKPFRDAMKSRLSEILELPLNAVSVKATTTETMGFTGRGEGMAAQALATIELFE